MPTRAAKDPLPTSDERQFFRARWVEAGWILSYGQIGSPVGSRIPLRLISICSFFSVGGCVPSMVATFQPSETATGARPVRGSFFGEIFADVVISRLPI